MPVKNIDDYRDDKRGLKGDNGFVAPGLHIAAPYSCNDGVFIEIEDPEYGTTWARTSEKEAVEKGCVIIECSICGKNATSLDHYFPYDSYHNRCDDCLNKK
jgi:hypothetical protein